MNIVESTTWSVSSSLSDGYYYVGCIVDASDQVIESDEDNNSYYVQDPKFEKITSLLKKMKDLNEK